MPVAEDDFFRRASLLRLGSTGYFVICLITTGHKFHRNFFLPGGELAAVKSIFTADSEITVTRIEAFDEQGPRLNVTRVTGETLPCSPQPSLVITDGATTYTLSHSNHFEPKSMATYTD